MLFGKLVEYLEKLEGTASRNEMTQILAELYKELGWQEAKEVTYLLSGTLGPAYRTPNFGVADKMFLRVFGEGAGEAFKRLGDMGLVAEELHTRRTANELSCADVYKMMWQTATVAGEGSQEKKVELIRELITHLDAKSAKYVARIVLGKLRTGFSDMTVLDALSWMLVGDKTLRKEIESMYNVRADLGEIAQIVKHQESNSKNQTTSQLIIQKISKEIQPELGTPILMAKAERASSADEIWERNGGCALEYKLDGLRIQAHISKSKAPSAKDQLNSNDKIVNSNFKVTLFSRGMEDMTEQFPEIVSGLAEQIRHDTIVEGEVIAVGSGGNFLPFQETIQRKRKHNIAEMSGKIPLKMFLYEILYFDGKSVMHEPNDKRRAMLVDLLKPGNTIKLIERTRAKDVEDIEKFFDTAVIDGTEGIIAKKLEGPYQAGSRDFNWIKYKKSYDKSTLNDTIDAVVMGYDAGQGKRANFGIGDFLIGVYDEQREMFVTVAKIGTGLSDEEWRLMKSKIDEIQSKTRPDEYDVQKTMNVDFWARPKIVVEVKADEITKSPMHTSGYALRFPRLVSWREKKPQDATSLKEFLGMFQKQTK